MAIEPTITVRPGAPAFGGTGWMVPAAAGIFCGSVIFDALPVALRALGWSGVAWALAGFAVMLFSGRTANGPNGGALAILASAGVWMHSLLEGVAAGAGSGQVLGGSIVVVLSLMVHLVPESVGLYTVAIGSGQSSTRAFVRCAVTWGLVVVGFLAMQLSAGFVPGRPIGAAMGLAAGIFTYLARTLWGHSAAPAVRSWLAAGLGLASVAILHL